MNTSIRLIFPIFTDCMPDCLPLQKNPDNDRYSFKLEFDHFVDGQTCFGLDKLALNNNYADVTNMKKAIVYDMFSYLGADAPLYNYTKISVNGEYWGIYLAVEAVEYSFMLRNYGMENGKLYKSDNMNLGGAKDFENKGNMPQGMTPPQIPQGNTDTKEQLQVSDFKGGFGGGMGESGGSNLNYTDDKLDSYSAIWNSSVNGSTKADHRRVVTALKNISEGNFQNGERPTPPGMGNSEQGNSPQNTETAESMSPMGFIREYQTPIISLVLLALVFMFVKFYKRRNY